MMPLVRDTNNGRINLGSGIRKLVSTQFPSKLKIIQNKSTFKGGKINIKTN